MARVWQLLVKADGDTKAAQREIRALQKSTRQFGQNMSSVGRSLTAAVTAPIVALGVLGVKELRETMVVTQKTDAVFESMGSTMKVTKGQLAKLVSGLEAYSAIEGDIIQNAANVGLSFKALAGNPKLFAATTRAAVDMSAALGTDLQQTMVQLGKAMQNGAKGAGALAKNGTLAKDDIAKLQKMAKDGVPIWKQQQFILAAVNKQYAGQGKNVDPIKAITVAVKNLAESLAVLLLPAITTVSGWVQRLSALVNGLTEQQRKWVGVSLLVAAALGPVLMVVGSLISASAALIPVIAAISAPMLAVAAAAAVVVAGLVYAYTTSEKFRDTVNTAFYSVRDAVLEVVESARATFTTWAGWYRAHADTIKSITTVVWNFIRGMIGGQLTVIRGVVQTVLALLRGDWSGAWEGIKTILSGAWQVIRTIVTTGISAIRGILSGGWSLVNSAASTAWNGFKNLAENALEAISGIASRALSGLAGKLGSIGSTAGAALANGIKGAVNAVIDRWNGLSFGIPAVKVAGKEVFGGADINTPDVPRLARGGITKGISIAGEAGPEAVIPMGRSAQNARDRMRVLGEAGLLGMGGGTSLNVTVNGANLDVDTLVRKLMFELGGSRLRMGGAV